jgi:hypothetical protein
MMTIKLLLRGRVSSQEILADTEQVQSKNGGLGAASGEEWFARTLGIRESAGRVRVRPER